MMSMREAASAGTRPASIAATNARPTVKLTTVASVRIAAILGRPSGTSVITVCRLR